MRRDGGLLLHGEVAVVDGDASASFVAFSLGAADGARFVERAAIVYVASGTGTGTGTGTGAGTGTGTVRDVEHEWHDRVEGGPPGAWLPVHDGGFDRLRWSAAGHGATASWVRVAPAPSWLGQGTAVWHATGTALASFGTVPEPVRDLVERRRPEFAFAPVPDLVAAMAAVPVRTRRLPGRRLH